MMFNYNTVHRVAALLIAHAGLQLLGADVRAQDIYVPLIKCWTVFSWTLGARGKKIFFQNFQKNFFSKSI